MLYVLIIGFVIGAIAKFLMPGKDPGGIVITILLGIAGSVVANWLGYSLGFYAYGEPAGMFSSIIGAMLLLGLYRAAMRRRLS